jgi:hypothetical protein
VLESLRLKVRSIRAADIGAFVPLKSEPLEAFEDRSQGCFDVALLVSIIDPQKELAPCLFCQQVVKQRGSYTTDVKVSSGAWGKSRTYRHLGFGNLSKES